MATKPRTGSASLKGKTKKLAIPDYLIKEKIEDIPFYFKGFRAVLNKTKTKTEIMADSGLQLFLKSWLMALLLKNLDLLKYHVFVGEAGAHIDQRNNLSLDLTIYDRTVLTPDKITNHYINVPPKIIIEIDVNVELEDPGINTFEDYVLQKIKKLHQFGVEKIIWIFTKSKTIIIVTPDEKWEVIDWDQSVEILNGVSFNVAEHLQREGIYTE